MFCVSGTASNVIVWHLGLLAHLMARLARPCLGVRRSWSRARKGALLRPVGNDPHSTLKSTLISLAPRDAGTLIFRPYYGIEWREGRPSEKAQLLHVTVSYRDLTGQSHTTLLFLKRKTFEPGMWIDYSTYLAQPTEPTEVGKALARQPHAAERPPARLATAPARWLGPAPTRLTNPTPSPGGQCLGLFDPQLIDERADEDVELIVAHLLTDKVDPLLLEERNHRRLAQEFPFDLLPEGVRPGRVGKLQGAGMLHLAVDAV
jgi:hypothetical protein